MNATRNSRELFEELVQALVEERIEGDEIEIDSMTDSDLNPSTSTSIAEIAPAVKLLGRYLLPRGP